jgi:hypothetical protein
MKLTSGAVRRLTNSTSHDVHLLGATDEVLWPSRRAPTQQLRPPRPETRPGGREPLRVLAWPLSGRCLAVVVSRCQPLSAWPFGVSYLCHRSQVSKHDSAILLRFCCVDTGGRGGSRTHTPDACLRASLLISDPGEGGGSWVPVEGVDRVADASCIPSRRITRDVATNVASKMVPGGLRRNTSGVIWPASETAGETINPL